MTFLETAELFGAFGVVAWLYTSYHRMKLKQLISKMEMERANRFATLRQDIQDAKEKIMQSLKDRVKAHEQKSYEEHEILGRGISEGLNSITNLAKILCAQSKSEAHISQFQNDCLQSLIRALYPIFVDTYDDFIENDDFEKSTAYNEVLKQLTGLSKVQSYTENIIFDSKAKDDEPEEEEQNA